MITADVHVREASGGRWELREERREVSDRERRTQEKNKFYYVDFALLEQHVSTFYFIIKQNPQTGNTTS